MKNSGHYFCIEPLLGGLLTTLLSLLLLRHGIILTPDGWAYWEGSVSLLHGDGFVYFGGQPIRHYPPLFSLYLALWQFVFGVSGWTLCLATAVSMGLSSALWIGLFRSLFGDQRTGLHSLLLVVFISSFLAACSGLLLSESLHFALQALLLIVLVRFLPTARQTPRETAGTSESVDASSSRPWSLTFWSVVLLVGSLFLLLLLCRNASLIFAPAIALFAWRFANGRRIDVRAVSFLAMTLIPIVAWYTVRKLLHQTGSHQLQLFGGRSYAGDYIWQFAESSAYLMGTGIVGAVLLIVVIAFLVRGTCLTDQSRNPREVGRIEFLFVFLVSSVADLWLIFNMTYIADPLKARYVWFVPLMLVGLAIALLTHSLASRWKTAVLVCLALVLIFQCYRTAVVVAVTLEPSKAMPRSDVAVISESFFDMYALHVMPGRLVSPHETLSPDWHQTAVNPEELKCKSQGDLLVVCPSHYRWIDRHYRQRQ